VVPTSDAVILELAGPLDIYTVPSLRALIDAHCDDARDILVDVREVTLIDSSGLGAFGTLRNRRRAEQRVVGVVSSQPTLRRIFEIAGLTDGFVVDETADAVCRRIRGLAGGDGV